MIRHPLALVLGTDTPIGLSIVRELGQNGVPVHGIGKSANAIGAASRYCLSSSIRPKNQALADWLPERILITGAKALLAISEDDLLALAALPAVINDCQILTPRMAPLTLVLDKSETLRHAKALGLLVPESWLPCLTDNFASRAAALSYPVVAKWPDPPNIIARLSAAGHALIKAEFVHDASALIMLLERYAGLGTWPLIQQYCSGEGLGQMLHIDKGRTTLYFQHRRLHEWPPEGGISTLCRVEPSVLHMDQMALSESLLNAIGWQGSAMVEYRHDRDTGRYWLMEINGRFWGSQPLATAAGAHFAWETYRKAVLNDLSPPPPFSQVMRARYMIPETRRLVRLLFNRALIADPLFKPRPLRDLAMYCVGFLDWRMRYFLFSISDPGPFFADIKAVALKFLRPGKLSPD